MKICLYGAASSTISNKHIENVENLGKYQRLRRFLITMFVDNL